MRVNSFTAFTLRRRPIFIREGERYYVRLPADAAQSPGDVIEVETQSGHVEKVQLRRTTSSYCGQGVDKDGNLVRWLPFNLWTWKRPGSVSVKLNLSKEES